MPCNRQNWLHVINYVSFLFLFEKVFLLLVTFVLAHIVSYSLFSLYSRVGPALGLTLFFFFFLYISMMWPNQNAKNRIFSMLLYYGTHLDTLNNKAQNYRVCPAFSVVLMWFYLDFTYGYSNFSYIDIIIDCMK